MNDELPNWTVEEVDDDGKPIGWRNQSNSTSSASSPTATSWVTRENSTIATVDTIDEARENARSYMQGHPRPNGMV